MAIIETIRMVIMRLAVSRRVMDWFSMAFFGMEFILASLSAVHVIQLSEVSLDYLLAQPL